MLLFVIYSGIRLVLIVEVWFQVHLKIKSPLTTPFIVQIN